MVGKIILLAVLILLNAIFAAAEIAVISMNDARLKQLAEDGNKRAVRLSKLVEQPSRFLATIQVAITLAGLLSSAFAADSFADPIVRAIKNSGSAMNENTLRTIIVIVITIILSYFNLVFGELVPKRIAMKKTEQLSLGLANLLYAVSIIFKPLVFILTASTNGILRLFKINPNENDEKVTEEEIRMLLSQGSEQGAIKEYENEIIQNVFELNDTTIEQICTHRVDVDMLDTSDTIEEWDRIIRKTRHSFYPVYKDNNENIIGVLNTKDYFRLKTKTKKTAIEHALEQPIYAPTGMKANVLFSRMKSKRNYFAVVIDEYGGFEGVVTLHDLMESIVGDFYDTDDGKVTEEIQKLSDDKYIIKGSAPIDDVSDALDLDLENEDYDTFNGYVYSITQAIPTDNKPFDCETDDLKISVKSVKNHIIQTALVTKKQKEKDPEE